MRHLFIATALLGAIAVAPVTRRRSRLILSGPVPVHWDMAPSLA